MAPKAKGEDLYSDRGACRIDSRGDRSPGQATHLRRPGIPHRCLTDRRSRVGLAHNCRRRQNSGSPAAVKRWLLPAKATLRTELVVAKPVPCPSESSRRWRAIRRHIARDQIFVRRLQRRAPFVLEGTTRLANRLEGSAHDQACKNSKARIRRTAKAAEQAGRSLTRRMLDRPSSSRIIGTISLFNCRPDCVERFQLWRHIHVEAGVDRLGQLALVHRHMDVGRSSRRRSANPYGA